MPLLTAWLLPALVGASLGAPAADTVGGALDADKPLSRFNIDLWTEEQGLPQNMASAILQTPDGYLWLGMEEGLVRFDGVRFEVFGPSNTPAFSTAWVTALHADPDGTLWVGTGGGGLVRMRDGEFRAFGDGAGLSHSHVRSIFRDRDGTLWVGTNGGGLNRLVDGGFEVLDSGDGLSSDFVAAIDQDSAGALWLGTGDGLNRLDPDGSIRVYRTADGLAGDRIRDVVAAGDELWIATTDGGVSRLRDGRFTTYSTAQGLSSDYATSLHRDAAGAIWVGTNGGGLNRIHDGRISSLTTRDRLPGNLVLTVAGDREGHVWMGLTGAGLARLRDGMFRTIGHPEGLSSDIGLALLEGRDGTAWIGTAGGGLNVLRDGRLSALTTDHGLAHNVVISLVQTRGGDIWVGTVAGGISRIRDGRIRTFGTEDGLVSTQVGDIVEDRAGRIWLATLDAGLQRWRPAPSVTYTRADGLPDDYVTTVHEHSDGALWVGTRRGLARLEDGRITVVPVDGAGGAGNNITGLYEDDEGVLWASTNRGVARVDRAGATLYGRDGGPLDREIHGVVKDTLGYLWLTSNDGILRVRARDLEAAPGGDLEGVAIDAYGRPDGLRSAEANGGINPAALRRSTGELWFPTMRGVAVVDPARVSGARPVPEPIVERVLARDSLHGTARPLVLPPGTRGLGLRFTAPTSVAPDELRFRYRLDGFDDDWVQAGDRRVAFYTNVPPGDYRFRVAVRRGDGEWREAASPFDIHLAPRFFETPAFLVLGVLLFLAIGVAGYRLRIRGLTRRQWELMRLVVERKRTEHALRLSEERLRLALEAGRMGTWEWDADSDAFTASGATAEILGFSPDTGQEALAQLAPLTTPADLERVIRIGSGLIEGRDGFELHFPLQFEDGERHHVEVRGQAFFDADGAVTRVAGVVADITTFMNTQEELRHREEELRQSQKMEAVGRLAGGVAHDFNNLLTAISGRTELVLDALPAEHGLREDIEEVRDAAGRAANLTQKLLTFSRKQVFQPRALDLNQVVGGVERMLRRLIREDVVLETRLDPDLGPVHADPVGMEQILLNLVVNAQDAMPDGGRVVIETRNGRGPLSAGDPHDRPHAILSVTDTGHGMDDETRSQAFEPFFTTKPLGKGTGLGLSTVYGIVQQSGGEIRMESHVDQGTRFDVYLPVVSGTPEAVAPAPAGTGGEHGSETILLVEDEPAVRSLARKVLERRGYTVLDAGCGAEALEVWHSAREAGRIDMLISDVVMPRMSGRELAERIRTLQPDIPILLMSGYNEDEVLRRGITPGSGMAFLRKPFEPATLVRRVREILDRGRVAAGT